MFKKLGKYLKDIMVEASYDLPKVVEIFLMAVAFWWAFVLLLPFTTLEYLELYTRMLSMAGENVWGLYFLFMGALHFVGLRYRKHKLMLIGLMLSTFTWMLIGMLMMMDLTGVIGAGTYMMIALLSASTYFYKGAKN